MSVIRYISDLHLDGRGPFRLEHPKYSSLEEWQSDLSSAWNAHVVDDDIVWVVGDVFIKPVSSAVETLRCLRGHLNLVTGNHDNVAKYSVYQDIFEQILDITDIIDDGRHVVLCHYPLESWNRKIYGSAHIFGHIHGNWWDCSNQLPNRYNVWCTALGGVPRTLDWLICRDGYDKDYYKRRAESYEMLHKLVSEK